MRELLRKANEAGLLLKVEDGKLKLFAEGNDIDPTILGEIKANKEEITSFLVNSGINEMYEADYAEIPTAASKSAYELSHSQRRLWVLSQFTEGAEAYNLPNNIHLNRPVNYELFEKAIYATIERHEILRTVFKEDENGEVKQWVLSMDDLSFSLDFKDYRENNNASEQIDEFIANDAYKAFDLGKGPLFRACLFQLADNSFIFYYNLHHIISDGWSGDILANDVFTFYEALLDNKTPELEILKIQYKDYAEWQLDELKKGAYEKHHAFWIENLAGELPVLDLPGALPRPKMKTYRGRALSTLINEADSDLLKNFTQENGGSLFMGLLATWNILMYHYADQKDVIIGTPVAGREHADLENQIGFYVNTLALRNELKNSDTFLAYYERLKQNTLNSFNHQMYPFDRLVEELEIQRDTSRSPVFDVSMSFHNSGNKNENFSLESDFVNAIQEVGDAKVKNDIELHFQEVGNYISFKIIYNEDIYGRSLIENIIGHYKRLLNALVSNSNEKLCLVDYLSENEKQELLVDFNNTSNSYKKSTLVNLFESQVQKTPDKTALVYKNEVLSFKTLNDRSNQFANYLKANYEIHPNDLIGIQLEKGVDAVIALLAVLKAGGAYVPVDANYPAERKEYIFNDSQIKLLITESAFIYDLDYYEGDVCAMDIEFEAEAYESENLKAQSGTDDLAYVIYTSGSTGMPKGVMIEHRAIVNTMLAQIDRFGIKTENNGLLFASLSFDASVSEMFIILLSGATLFVADEAVRKDPEKLMDYIRENEIDVATIPPSYLSKMDINGLSGLKKLITAGEQASLSNAEDFVKLGKDNIYFNAYGPTEASICGTIFELNTATHNLEGNLPVGKPVANAKIFILGDDLELKPKGVPGEICISGNGLTRGYLNKPDLTAEKIVANPHDNGELLYRTGDMGKWLEDGNVEFIGRRDDQVKIRGYRVELAEIEYALNKFSSVDRVTVMVVDGQDGEKEVAAWIAAQTELNSLQLRDHLSKLLPDYMIPTNFIQVEEFPLTTNGKIDRKALLAQSDSAISTGTEYVAPRNEVEKEMVLIWEKILGRENIGVKDNFFELGGHSLKAIILINKVEKEFQIKLKIEELLSNPTVEIMCKDIRAKQWVDTDTSNEINNDERETIEL